MLKEHTFHTGEVSLNYAEGPRNGPPLVLFTGFTGRWQAFSSIIPLLLPRWHIFALDYCGHGKSDRTPRRYKASDYSADCRAFLERRIAAPAVLLGSSAGGSIALEIAATHPATVRAVIGLDPPVDFVRFIANFGLEMAAWWAEEQRLASRPLEELLPEVPRDRAEELACLDPEVMRFHAAGHIHEFFADLPPVLELEQIACPVLLVQGNPALGAILTDQDIAYARASLPRLTIVRVDDRGHEVGLDGDAAWAPAMLAFLESV